MSRTEAIFKAVSEAVTRIQRGEVARPRVIERFPGSGHFTITTDQTRDLTENRKGLRI